MGLVGGGGERPEKKPSGKKDLGKEEEDLEIVCHALQEVCGIKSIEKKRLQGQAVKKQKKERGEEERGGQSKASTRKGGLLRKR